MVNCVTGNCLKEENKLLNNLNLQQVRYFLTVIIIIIYIYCTGGEGYKAIKNYII